VLFAVVVATTLSCAPAVAVKSAKPALPALPPVVETGPSPAVIALARRAVACAAREGLVPRPDLLTLIDYSRASTEPRLWVLDLWSGRVLRRELVAHGRESGDLMATRFSNRVGSLQSSLGLFVTGETYEGRHGRSLVLHGLEAGVNDLALDRAIVMHGADYVSLAFAEQHGGRIGRSHGCPALASHVAPQVIDTIRDGSPLFVYYPDVEWLASSRFLAACEGAAATAAVAPR
jgi:hypothetical protein